MDTNLPVNASSSRILNEEHVKLSLSMDIFVHAQQSIDIIGLIVQCLERVEAIQLEYFAPP